MFFFLAKTFGFAAHLPHLLLEIALVGVALMWTRWARAGRWLATGGVLALAVAGFTPFSALLVRPLEDRFPRPDLSVAPTGIIVLGGAVDEGVTRRRGLPALNDAAERMTEAVALARRFPDARLVFAGGSGRFTPLETTESDVARQFFLAQGVPAARMTFENQSRDTWENAAFTRALVQSKPGETWLLVTSAMHMPRSVGIFRQVGFPVTAYPVDYRTGGGLGDFVGLRRMGQSINDLDAASHEWIGLFAYYLTGKSTALFPAP